MDYPPLVPDPLDEAVRLHELAVSAREDGRLEDARTLAAGSLEIFETESDPNSPDIANVLLCLAGVLHDLAKYIDAEPLYRRAVAIVSTWPDETSADIDLRRLRIQANGGLGTILRILGRYREAEAFLQTALSIAERTFDAGDPEIADAMNDLAVVYKYTGEFDKASALYRKALASIEKAGGASFLGFWIAWSQKPEAARSGIEHHCLARVAVPLRLSRGC